MTYYAEFNPNFGELGVQVARKWPEAEEVIRVKGKTKDTLGLALSGGGYRSAIFNYGVLKGLYQIGVLDKFDYVSAVSGGSWIATPFAMTEDPDFFFYEKETGPNFFEESFESFLINPVRVAEEAALARADSNFASDIFGRLLARTFLREHGDYSRTRPLADGSLIRDGAKRPFLIINGTLNYRAPGDFQVTQECFEMTRLYCGSRTLGYVPATEVQSAHDGKTPLRIRDAIAVSGAALAIHLPGLGGEVSGMGLSREVRNFTAALPASKRSPQMPDTEMVDVADGGFYNNLGVESLINRGCGYIIICDAEHDPEAPKDRRSNQKYEALRTLLQRGHIRLPKMTLDGLDPLNTAVSVFSGGPQRPDILYIKLKSSSAFDRAVRNRPYNRQGFFNRLLGEGEFHFNPQYSTAKLDYGFAEHRNLSDLGSFYVHRNKKLIQEFIGRAK